ncbi:MAG: hypothetical protein LBG08_04390 [Spirochaetaceae bacterium]|jgi:hypothetical protein|nr:hypothetical protein [Spirochaetaceae bacterium]
MKKIFCLILAAALALLVIGCAGSPAAASASAPGPAAAVSPLAALPGVPQFVNDAYVNASEDVLIGIGTYKIGNDTSKMGSAMTFGQTRARVDIARQLQSIIRDMVIDYTAQSELDPSAALSFQENISQALAKADLRGARVIQSQTQDGLLWVVMEYSKSAAANDYSAAAAAAKLAVPAAAAFDALARMENAFDKAAGGGPIPVGD